MALFAVGERQTPVTTIPHQLLFNGWKSRLQRLEIQAINLKFDRLVRTTKNGEICAVRWLPCEISPLGHSDWDGSPFMKIWTKACEGDRDRTCWCFALLLWEHMMNRPEAWHFQMRDLDHVPMAATKYHCCTHRDAVAAWGQQPNPLDSVQQMEC
jgi:hypothetical protein